MVVHLSNVFTYHTASDVTFFVSINSAPRVSVNAGSSPSFVCEANTNASITWVFNGLQIRVSLISCSI